MRRRYLPRILGIASCIAAAASIVVAAKAQETAQLTPPHDWLRQPVDEAHARLFPRARTVGKWTPQRLAVGDPTALYFALGDANGASLDAYAKNVVAAFPAGATNVNITDGIGCKGVPARLAAYDLLSSGVHIEEAIALGDTAAALAAYVRPAGEPADPVAMAALASLCPQSE